MEELEPTKKKIQILQKFSMSTEHVNELAVHSNRPQPFHDNLKKLELGGEFGDSSTAWTVFPPFRN